MIEQVTFKIPITLTVKSFCAFDAHTINPIEIKHKTAVSTRTICI